MSLATPRNPNYCATVVSPTTFIDLPNCDNVKHALIFGNLVIVAKDMEPGGFGLYFPPETQLANEFMAANNLYRKPEWGNVDPERSGFFEEHGRVKTLKFRGHKSEGFYIPLTALTYIFKDMPAIDIVQQTDLGCVFDFLNGKEICRKYVPKTNRVAGTPGQPRALRSLESLIVPGQFAFHYDTENLRRNAHKLNPTDIISITDKWHGTSVVIGRLLVTRQLSLVERVAKFFGAKVKESQYGYTYSSRKVIKAAGTGIWTDDIWGIVAKEVEDRVPNGFTLYGEIVGFEPSGKAIQAGYSYGCEPFKHKLVVYRITVTTSDNVVVEIGWAQVQEFCEKYGLHTVPTIFKGAAGTWLHFFLNETVESWQVRLVENLEKMYVNDADCSYNPKGTPAEGLVVRKDGLHKAEALKLKNFRFLLAESKSLDKGEVDTETAQSEPELVAA